MKQELSPGFEGWRRERRALNAPSTNFWPILQFLAFSDPARRVSFLLIPLQKLVSASSALLKPLIFLSWLFFLKDLLTFLIHCCLCSQFPFPCVFMHFFNLVRLFLFYSHYFGGIGRRRDKHMFNLPCLTASLWGFEFRLAFNAIKFIQGNSCFKRKEKSSFFILPLPLTLSATQ